VKHKSKQWLRRLGAGLATAALVAVLPVNWRRLGEGLTLTAAALHQPQNAVALLEERLTPSPVVTLPGETAPPSLGEGDRTGVLAVPDVPAAAPVTVPPEDGTGGKILTRTLDPGDTTRHPVAVRNRSNRTVDIDTALATAFRGRFTDTTQPQVLILHTHTTEGYMTYDAGYYNAADRNRTSDESRNVCAVGEAMAATLRRAGIAVLHDTTIHDSPQYTGAYDRSAATARRYLEKYPSLRVIIDLHRDAVMEDNTTLVKPTVTVDGRQAAQMMFVVGVTHTSDLPHPHWEQNLALAAQWQQKLTALAPALMRPLNTVQSRYNQHLAPGYLLVEVGSEGNTLEEAVYSGQLLGNTLVDLLK